MDDFNSLILSFYLCFFPAKQLILDQMRNEFESTRSQLRTAQTELIQYKQNEELLR